MEFIDLKTQYRALQDSIKRRIDAVLEHGQYILGPEVAEAETALAEFTGSRHCITCSSGTDALLLSLLALGVRPGDEVITSVFTFIATAEVIALIGARPVFIDVEPDTYNIDAKLIEAKITPKTKVIMPVGLYGQTADMDAIGEIAERHHLAVVEDAAQSFGARYRGRASCNLSLIGCTSFFPAKPLGCYGDGGACFTNDDELAQRLRELRVHGQDRRYHHAHVGINGRFDTLQAAILLAKLERFPAEVQARQEIGERYSRLLQSTCSMLQTPFIRDDCTSVYAQYTIQVQHRDRMQALLAERGIPTAVHYPYAVCDQPAIGPVDGEYPVARRVAQQVLSLPMHPELTERQQRTIVEALCDSMHACAEENSA